MKLIQIISILLIGITASANSPFHPLPTTHLKPPLTLKSDFGTLTIYLPHESIAYPNKTGFPTVLFATGFLLKTSQYDDLLGQIASKGTGAVVVGYEGGSTDPEDLKKMQKFVQSGAVERFVWGSGVRVDTKTLFYAGHSAGCREVMLMARGNAAAAGFILIDPVDSKNGGLATPMEPDAPVLIIGNHLSLKKLNFLFPACATPGFSSAFFNTQLKGSTHHYANVEMYGHGDMMDDGEMGVVGLTCTLAKDQKETPNADLRNFIGGLSASFIESYTGVWCGNFKYIVDSSTFNVKATMQVTQVGPSKC